MLASNVIISEETRKKNQLSKREQGRLRYEKLKECEKSGELSFATTRNELAQMVGYPDGDKTGVSWVNNMVNRGYISESLVGYQDGKMRKEFHLTNKTPDYNSKAVKNAHQNMKAEQKTKEIAVAKELEKRERESNITIKKGDITITATLDANDIVRIITNII